MLDFSTQCRNIGFEIHEEVLKALHELHTAMKTHHAYQGEFRQAESKLAVSLRIESQNEYIIIWCRLLRNKERN